MLLRPCVTKYLKYSDLSDLELDGQRMEFFTLHISLLVPGVVVLDIISLYMSPGVSAAFPEHSILSYL